MFTANLKIRDGLARWADSLPSLFRKRIRESPVSKPPADRPPPQTEGERALYQAMGWTDHAWEE